MNAQVLMVLIIAGFLLFVALMGIAICVIGAWSDEAMRRIMDAESREQRAESREGIDSHL